MALAQEHRRQFAVDQGPGRQAHLLPERVGDQGPVDGAVRDARLAFMGISGQAGAA